MKNYKDLTPVDWVKVEIDTPVLVSNCIPNDNEKRIWHKNHFARYKDGYVYTWAGGRTSWTIYNKDDEFVYIKWEYAKLAEKE